MLTKIFSKAPKNLLFKSVRAFSNTAWSDITQAPADPILGLNEAFKACTNPSKQLLGMGAYRDNDGKPYILPVVDKAERRIRELGMDHEYAPIDGIASYRKAAAILGWGKKIADQNRVAACQSISGTGSLRVGFEFIRQWYPKKKATVYVPDPTWPAHMGIVTKAGFEWAKYRYYDRDSKTFDCVGMLEDLDKIDNESIILLQVCAHNPTGCDPTHDEWRQILEVVKRKNHFCAFDNAYQGFATGDLDNDSFSLRTFAEGTDRLCLFQSFAKNFGLYGERAGCVSFLCADEAEASKVQSRIKAVARPMYSSPPIHGARIVDIILNDPAMYAEWQESLDIMSGRIKDMRGALVAKLAAAGSQHDWSHITRQIGMFAYTGLNADQVHHLIHDHHIYLTADGRISVAGLNTGNIDRVVDAFHLVSK